jgi:choline/glycine/proline betaine transport protein
VRDALVEGGLENSRVEMDENGVWLVVEHANSRDFLYRIGARSRPLPALTALEAPEGRRALEWRMTAQTGDGTRARDLTGFTRAQIVADVLDHLQRWRLAA